MKKSVLLIVFLLASCAPQRVELESKQPIIVEHRVNLDGLNEFFLDLCRDLLPADATEDEVKDCQAESTAKFLGTYDVSSS